MNNSLLFQTNESNKNTEKTREKKFKNSVSSVAK